MVKQKVEKPKVNVVRPEVLQTTFDGPASTYAGIRLWNLVCGLILTAQGVLIWVIGHGRLFPVTIQYQAQDPLQTAAQGTPVLAQATHHWFDVNVLYIVVAWLLVSGIMHLLLATLLRSRLEANLDNGSNKYRWYASTVTATLSILALGLLFGVQDASFLFALAGFMLVVHLGGLLIEKPGLPLEPLRKLAVIFGVVCAVIPWAILTQQLVSANTYGVAPASYEWWLYVVVSALFVVYGATMILRHRARGIWTAFLFGERVYMVTNVVGLSALAWITYAGVLK